ncbi:hypothetical protein RRG08_046699 [Elysia crispata]|uniref:Uncharacterized protein n=1 Tax=Elysia crispata TaxID=231223 RepID=A0AAE1A9X6_9GAST|nr:hypothetical protein RRG08_046699 [Elysia crispata]
MPFTLSGPEPADDPGEKSQVVLQAPVGPICCRLPPAACRLLLAACCLPPAACRKPCVSPGPGVCHPQSAISSSSRSQQTRKPPDDNQSPLTQLVGRSNPR